MITKYNIESFKYYTYNMYACLRQISKTNNKNIKYKNNK